MRIRNVLAISLLFCSARWIVYGQDSSFQAVIKVTRTVVRDNETFFLVTAIRNASGVEQSLDVWDCSYPTQWTSDNPLVHINGVDCLQNSLAKIKLKPGSAYERVVPVHIEHQAHHSGRKSVTFRLRYGTAAYFGTRESLPGVKSNWSNSVTIVVTGK